MTVFSLACMHPQCGSKLHKRVDSDSGDKLAYEKNMAGLELKTWGDNLRNIKRH